MRWPLLFLLFYALGWLPTMAEGCLVIKGSNTFGEELAPRLVQEFRKTNPRAKIKLESKGTATGFAALLAGGCDIASASRPINEDESRLARSRGIRLNPYLIGYYAVTVIVNSSNSVWRLSDARVRDVFTGVITNWEQIGGIDAPINLYIRDSRSGTHLGFQELAMEHKTYATSAQAFQEYATIAVKVAEDPHGIGYVGMRLSHWPETRAVAINSVVPSAQAVEEGRYPYARMLRLYTNAGRESAMAKRFIQFVLSQSGQALLEEIGYVPCLENQRSTPPEP